MRTCKSALYIVVIVLVITLAVPLAAQEDELSAEEVVLALGTALNEGDVDLAMTYIADDAVFGGDFAGIGYSVGAEEIRTEFEALVEINFRIETDIVATHGEGQVVITDTRTWNDISIEVGIAPLEFTEIYLVKDEQIFGIVYATWAATEERFLTAMAAMAPPPVTAEVIVGTWRWHSGGFYFQFRNDGTFRASQTLSDLNSDTPEDIGAYRVEDGILTLNSGEITRYCAEGDVGVYALNIREDGVLELLLQSDDCTSREAPSTNPQPFTRVEE